MLGARSIRTALPSWRSSPTWQAAQVIPTKSMPNVKGLDDTVRPTGKPSSRAGSGNRPKRSRFFDERLVRARVGDVDRGEQDPWCDLCTLRQVIVGFLLRRCQSVAVVCDDRRIGAAEFDLHHVVEH